MFPENGAGRDDSQPAPPDAESISNGFNQFDFSIDDNLANELANAPQKETEKPAPQKSEHKLPSIADEIAVGPRESKQEIPQNNELLRGVDNIDYDFSSNNIKKMREADKIAAYNDGTLIKESPAGFRSWIYDGKYVIDQPLPSPQHIKPYSANLIMRILLAMMPVLIMLALTAVAAAFSTILGLIFLLLTIVCIVFSLPDILPPSQQTIQATLSAYLQARAGYCINRGSALIAHEKATTDFSLADLWKGEGYKLPNALLERFKPVHVPEYTTISGSDSQNALLILATTKDAYYLIPMARTDERWFIMDPTLGKHTIQEQKEAQG